MMTARQPTEETAVIFHPSLEALRLMVVEAATEEEDLWLTSGKSDEHAAAADKREAADAAYCDALVRAGVFQKAAEYLSERIGEPVEVDWYDTGDPDVEYWCAPVQASVLDEDGLVAEFAICDAAGDEWVEHLLRSLSEELLRSVHP
jgi:hypothetical protein